MQLEKQCHAEELAGVQRKAYRVINHTSKRVMTNTAQCCAVVVEKLEALDLGAGEHRRKQATPPEEA